ncbi:MULTISPECIES: patatin-like phospholipase family protein [Sulfurovum]|uniref:Patatin-like phospholipase family protein n=1 Tax=Sulfurovum xiamenensis TaxID=3019066 RepID=A0ABT7QQT6_9BACT|nr:MULTISPECIES: patatin-like phospholipase family protein [Sulfurovum]EIF51726.1 patatin [Sulfurovum sp. AR]MDM5263436.1 patatin-like phospholipase family protein [Sulfurovum xiamenensis]
MIKQIFLQIVLMLLLPLLLFADSQQIKKDSNMQKDNKTVSLVLGSGGARGYAHIGVIETLEKKGYTIKSISGSSMGALIGGLYAAGKLDAYKKWVLSLDFIDTLKLIDISLAHGGIVNIDSVYQKIEQMIGDITIEDLPITYMAVASDIKNRKKVCFREGKLIDAIRASIAIPTVFTPVIENDMILVDGGVLEPLPIASVLSDDTDIIIAVNLNANIQNTYHIERLEKEKKAENRLYKKTLELVDKAKEAIGKDSSKEKPPIDILYILNKSLDATQSLIIENTLKEYEPDLMIEIPRDACEAYEFDKAYEMIEIGIRATQKSLETVK